MKLKAKALSTLLAVSCALIVGTAPTMAQNPASHVERKVLGFITLGTTTLTQFQDEIKARDCKFEMKGNSIYVPSGCFKLPGSPEITAESPDGSGIVDIVEVKFTRDKDFDVARTYMTTLRRTRGEEIASKGNLNVGEALWRTSTTTILMSLQNHDPFGYIYFATNKAFDETLADKSPEVAQYSDLAVF